MVACAACWSKISQCGRKTQDDPTSAEKEGQADGAETVHPPARSKQAPASHDEMERGASADSRAGDGEGSKSGSAPKPQGKKGKKKGKHSARH